MEFIISSEPDTQPEPKIIGIKTLTNKQIGIIYDPNVTKTVGDIFDILMMKIKYCFTGLGNLNKKLIFFDQKTKSTDKLDLQILLSTISDSLILSIDSLSNDYFDTYQHIYDSTKFELFDTPESITVYMNSLTGKTYVINVDISKATTLDLKYKLKDIGIISDACNARLVFSGYQLEDKQLLSYYKITPWSTIHIVLRLRGGMMAEVSGKSGYSPLEPITLYNSITDEFIQT